MKILLPAILLCWISWVAQAQTAEKLKFVSVWASENTGQDYHPWLSESLDTLVQEVWDGNFKYVDVTLKLETRSYIKKLRLFDGQGTFTEQPATFYAIDGNQKTLLGTFEGMTYLTYVEIVLPDSVPAQAIQIHKYSNNFPLKIIPYGYEGVPCPCPDPLVEPTPDPEPEPEPEPTPTTPLVKIPIDPSRWYQLNTPSYSMNAFFDGVTNVNVELGWGKMFNNFDAYYAVEEGEEITLSSVKFYDWEGQLGDYPMTLSVITNDWQRIPIATFNGNRYATWVGPYPDRETTEENRFKLDSTYHNIRFLVLNLWYMFPTEIEFYGQYTAPPAPTAAQTPAVKLSDTFGVNAFEWDFLNVYNPMTIDEPAFEAIKSFRGVRHYIDWEKLESSEGSYTFSPVHSGSWNYDIIYERCKAEGIEVLACLKTIPGWMRDTYPENMRDPENTPVRYGKDFSDPASYIEQARVAFQYVARYGSNTQVDTSLLSVNPTSRWTDDPVNTVKVGLGVIKYIECDNERDKWWKGRRAYQTAYEYAANLSAFYDGHKNTLGPGIGVKNADPSIKVVMAGLASPSTDYVRGMIDWCKQNRGYRPDGSVDLCWDVINYHYYANDSHVSQGGNSTRGSAPERSQAAQVAEQFVQLAHHYANDMPVWITEAGYDLNQGSPLKAIPIGNKTAEDTQADWTLRSALLYARAGIQKVFHYQLYDDNPYAPIQFGSMGMINQNRSRRAAADYLFQVNKVLGEYTYDQTLNQDPLVDRYVHQGQEAFMLVVPDEIGRTATYSLTVGSDSVRIYTPRKGAATMDYITVAPVNGSVQVNVTETPVFVQKATTSGASSRVGVAELASEELPFTIYPNPTADMVYVQSSNTPLQPYEIRVYSPSGTLHKRVANQTAAGVIRERVDLSSLPVGIYVLELVQGERRLSRKIIRTR